MSNMNKRENYIEDLTFSLPYIENNALSLGTLWDCHLSKVTGFNLFKKQFKNDHLIIHLLKKLDYCLIHVKSMEDKLTILKINGAMLIEILSGILHVEGSGDYDKTFSGNSNEEQLICEYNLDNYLIELLPKAKEVMDNIVKNKLFEQNIKATHVVNRIILEAKVSANIRIRQNDTNKNMAIKGSLIGGISFGQVNASLKTSLKMLDSEKLVITNVDKCIQKEQNYKFIGPDITGVLVRFNLVPISQFLDIKIEKLYKQLKEHCLQKILSDSKSKLSKDIKGYQKDLEKATSNYFEKACEALKKYKVKECNPEELFQIMRDYDESNFCIVRVCANIEKFVSHRRNELNIINEKDATLMDINIIYFTNFDELNGWLNSGINIKVLLWTSTNSFKGNFPNRVFQNLFKIVNELQKQIVEVGIALPSISNNFSLEIKDHQISKIYSIAEIPQILRILSVAIGMENPIESHFYMLSALHKKIKLPLELKYFSELNNIISLLQVDFKVYIAHSYIDSLQRSCSFNYEDLRWKFFIALDAPDTALDAIFTIKSVCLDELDFLILLQIFKSKNFLVLSYNSLHYSFYPNRSKFFIEFIKTVNRTKIFKLSIAALDKPFNQVPDQSLSDTLNVVHSALFEKNLDVISSIAQLAIRNDYDLITHFIKYGWSTADLKFSNKVLSAEGSKSLCAVLHDRLKSCDPFLAKVECAKNAIEKALNNLDDINAQMNLIESVDSIYKDPNCAVEIKANIEKCETIMNLKLSYNKYAKIFDQLTTKFVKKESFHVLNLISLLKSILISANREFSDVLINEIIPCYINRLPQYMDSYKSRWDEIKESMNRKLLPDLVSLLSKLHCNPQLYKLHEKLNKISDINNQNDIKQLFELSKNFTDEQNKYLWKNSRFIYLVQNAASSMPLVVNSTLFKSNNIKEYPSYVPESIQRLLREYMKERDEQANVSPNELKYDIFRTLIAKNKELERSLKSAGVLSDDNWDSKDKISKGWDRDTIELALKKLNK
ncbi:38785_t:CDS:2 [Gigaspora margarita]|uniref:38785_t:CDS:1 n=1 Tax=Gigaspora margarita TaxID=4874 RepID=A0ABM8W736_GIGMA|nr:38785_t:CDS:2 [Gigaspora margarita]